MRLVIAEKPSVARDLARVLGAKTRGDGFLEGAGLRITWCIGHLAELEDPVHYDAAWKRWSFDTLPMVPAKFELRLRTGVADHWALIKRLLRDRTIEDVVNACDAGREGELIFRYVYELAGCTKPVMRLWTSSLTDEAIHDAWSRLAPGSRFDALGDAARCRSEADWLVGLNATRALTCLARAGGGEQLLSVGRVQTPTLAMIVERDRQIDAFVPEAYWTIKARFEAEKGAWDAAWFRPVKEPVRADGEKPDEDEAPHAERVGDPASAEQIAAAARGRTGEVVEAERRRTREQPPLLYDLTSLQRRANERYGLSAPRTLQVAQALYEKHKLITYPRTDARHITPDQVGELPKILRGLAGLGVYKPFADAILAAGPPRPGKRVVDATEVGDHHAILPTGRVPDAGRLDPDEKRVFDLVARRLLAALSPDAVFDLTTLIVAVPTDAALPPEIESPLKFRARGRICREEGWRAIDPPGKSREVDLPPVERGDAAKAVKTAVTEGATRPPRPYTDSTLLRAMETAGRALDDEALKRAMRNAGLGTPATRADILQTLLDRTYIERKARDLRATDRGKSLIGAIPLAELKSAELTGRWEARLAAIADGHESRPGFMAAVAEHTAAIVAAIRAAEPPAPEVSDKEPAAILGNCPACGKPVREGRMVYGCETGRECAFVVFKSMAKRAISARMVKQLLAKGRTDAIKGFKSKAGKPFDAGLEWKDGKVSFWFPERVAEAPKPASPVGLACPKCGAGHVVRGKAAWGCDRWREGCRFVVPFEVDGRARTEADAVRVILGG
jgi:DNA topoisomerase-3